MRSYLIAPLAFAVSMSSCSLLVRDVEADDACGNSIVQEGLGEECDDGNVATEDGCSPDCKIEPFCGDGVQGPDEACDDNNSESGDGCSDRCVVEFCGDGVDNNNNAEECDEGDENSDNTPDACREDCTNPSCGDAVTDTGETCDDGNTINNDGCSSVCLAERCGDGVIQQGEECDDGPANSNTSPDACRENCFDPFCGDSVRDSNEECDDGNIANADDCSSECKIEILTELEPNDVFANAQAYDNINFGGKLDGALPNASDIDFFRITLSQTTSLSVTVAEAVAPNGDQCTINPLNPDTVLYLFSDPGPGNGQPIILFEDDDNGPGTCSKMTLPRLAPGSYFIRLNNFGFQEPITSYRLDIDVLASCGDGQITPPFETCEGLVGCLANCTNGGNCGDGILDVAEQCDDSDTSGGDGCSATCQIEPGNFFEVEPNDDARLEEGNDNIGSGDFLFSNAGLPFTADVTIHGRMLIGGGDEDYYLIRNPTATATTVTIQTADPAQGFSNGLCGTNCDTNLRLFRLAGNNLGPLVDSNDDTPGIGLCSLIQNAPLGPNETLVLQVTESGDNEPIPSYLVRIDFQ